MHDDAMVLGVAAPPQPSPRESGCGPSFVHAQVRPIARLVTRSAPHVEYALLAESHGTQAALLLNADRLIAAHVHALPR